MIREQEANPYKYVGDSVNVGNFATGDTRLLGTIDESRGTLSFQVKL